MATVPATPAVVASNSTCFSSVYALLQKGSVPFFWSARLTVPFCYFLSGDTF